MEIFGKIAKLKEAIQKDTTLPFKIVDDPKTILQPNMMFILDVEGAIPRKTYGGYEVNAHHGIILTVPLKNAFNTLDGHIDELLSKMQEVYPIATIDSFDYKIFPAQNVAALYLSFEVKWAE